MSIDVRGENYWNEFFAPEEGASHLTASRSTVLTESEDDIAQAERELARGKASTLAELLAEVFDSALPGQLAGGEDLSRELE